MRLTKSFVLVTTFILAAGPIMAQAAARAGIPHRSYDLILPGILLRPGVTVDLHATVFVDESHPCQGNVALAVHGMLHTAASWERMAASLFEQNPAGRKFCRVVALDMPGHGASGVPKNLWFGALTIDDDVTALLGALDRLKAQNVRPHTVFAHSLGGLLVQTAQQKLVEEGTNLRQAYGVKNVVLLAAAPPGQLPASSIDSGMLSQVIMTFAQINPVAGTAGISDEVWAWLFFAPDPNNPSQVVSGAPTPEEVSTRHYNAAEPLALLGALMNRPAISTGVFEPIHGTALTVVTYEADVVIRPDESRAMYAYLTGDETGSRFVLVPGFEAVHDTHISNPALLVDSIAEVERLP